MKCTISTERSGQLYTYGITQENKRIKVLSGHLFYGKTIEIEKYNDEFYNIKKLNYDENKILSRYVDDDGLIPLEKINEAHHVSTPYKRIYEIDSCWLFVPKPIIKIVEFLYSNNLVTNSKVRLTKSHTEISGRAPIYNVNYDKIFDKVMKEKKSISAHYYCERSKDFANGCYADFYVIANLNEGNFQLQFWEIIGDGQELFYSHFIKNPTMDTFNHFDLATHYLRNGCKVEDLLQRKSKLEIDKYKWFRNDDNLSKDQVFDITKLFFPLEILIDEFNIKNYT